MAFLEYTAIWTHSDIATEARLLNVGDSILAAGLYQTDTKSYARIRRITAEKKACQVIELYSDPTGRSLKVTADQYFLVYLIGKEPPTWISAGDLESSDKLFTFRNETFKVSLSKERQEKVFYTIETEGFCPFYAEAIVVR